MPEIIKLDQTPFSSVISLGAHCAVRYHIDRYFGKAGSGPFEWTVSPLQSVIDAIVNNFDKIADQVSTISDGHSTIDRKYGICYHHEFERADDGKAIIDAAALLNMRSKMLHKCRSFGFNIAKGSVLFVRYGSEKRDAVANISMTDEPIRFSRLNELVRAITAAYPNTKFRLAYVHHPNVWGNIISDDVLDDRVDVYSFDWIGGTDWTGNEDKWDRLFAGYRNDDDGSSSIDFKIDPMNVLAREDLTAPSVVSDSAPERIAVQYTDKMRAALNEASYLQEKIDSLLAQQQDSLADIILGSVNESRRVIGMVEYELHRLRTEGARASEQ